MSTPGHHGAAYLQLLLSQSSSQGNLQTQGVISNSQPRPGTTSIHHHGMMGGPTQASGKRAGQSGNRNAGAGSASPHKAPIQPHQKRDIGAPTMGPSAGQQFPQTPGQYTTQSQLQLNQQSQKMIAKRAAAKVVRRKINESLQTTSKSIISHNVTNNNANNQTLSEVSNPVGPTAVITPSHPTQFSNHQAQNGIGPLKQQQTHAGNTNLTKITQTQGISLMGRLQSNQQPVVKLDLNSNNLVVPGAATTQLNTPQFNARASMRGVNTSLSPQNNTNFAKKPFQSQQNNEMPINVVVPKKNLPQMVKSKSPPMRTPAFDHLASVSIPADIILPQRGLSPPHPTSQPKMLSKQIYQQPVKSQTQPQNIKAGSNHPQQQFQKIPVPPLQQQRRGFPMGGGSQQHQTVVVPMKQSMRKEEDGEKKLNKRQQMRLPSDRERNHNMTRSLIEDGSEDFTNIEEHLQEDTRISCRQAVASSLQNVSQLIKQGHNAYGLVTNNGGRDHNQSQVNVRQRRATTHSNISVQGGKEDTFESSSFFDEGLPTQSNRYLLMFSNQAQPPHKCNQVDNYNLPPTIFNTLMFGIDQSKVSTHVRESFSKLQSSGSQSAIQKNPTPLKSEDAAQKAAGSRRKSSGRGRQGENNSSEYYAKAQSNGQSSGINSLVTKVDKFQSLPLQVEQQHKEEEKHDDQGEEEGSNLGDPVSDPAALGTIEDFQSSELHRNHLIQTLQSLQYIKTLPPVNKNDLKSRSVKLPNFKLQHIKKTIIFDLDETLVHCIDDIERNPCDKDISVTFPNGETVKAGINIRPYALECLRKANESYQVVVFTASHKAYADVVLNMLDPTGELIQYRLYRDHCIRTEEGIYVKDLRIITNRNLKDLIIVDNAVYSFGYQLDNGIPIIPFYDDKSDEELMHLIFYFTCLAQCEDVREQNRKAFQLKDLQEIDIAEYLHSMMNSKRVAQVEQEVQQKTHNSEDDTLVKDGHGHDLDNFQYEDDEENLPDGL